MKTYIIVNGKGEQIGTIQRADTANPATFNRIIKSVYGKNAKAIEA
jgi:hypothetical protein